MILTRAVHEGIADGTITVVFRRWAKPNVRQGDTLTTALGVVRIDSVEVVEPSAITDAEAARAGQRSAGAVLASLRGPEGVPVYRIGVSWAGPDPRHALSAEADLTDDQLDDIAARLERLDRRGAHGPWTHAVLRLIEANPARRAGDLAAMLERETQPFKLDVRKLKNLGLTHSLDVGYRLSPRGAAYLALRG
ncbi:ASCH domain-containing protein [Prauserella cavernicola]|uniref:ASCH domain-containing protein n=1 Tax=Prauserella cavernicola TaxID=2800127 RepID=A0A934QMG6_9PSEU|nr:ASCH domain-containing protein [Prauserella cavernicola]MBK1782775.1 ASCH domain-containing protein [Prauserella cavernicola]